MATAMSPGKKAVVGKIIKMAGKFTVKSGKYFGLSEEMHTVSWRDQPDVNSAEVKKWCSRTFGKSGYNEKTKENRWIFDKAGCEIVFSNAADLTAFLLKWT